MSDTKDRIIDMILADSSARNMLTLEAKTELFLYYVDKTRDKTVALGLKTEQAADLYLLAKDFGIHRAQRVVSDYLGCSLSTFDRRLYMARYKGLLPTKKGTTHGIK